MWRHKKIIGEEVEKSKKKRFLCSKNFLLTESPVHDVVE
jgi:hypothetical protein